MEFGSPNHSLNSVQLEKCTIDDELDCKDVTSNDVFTSFRSEMEASAHGVTRGNDNDGVDKAYFDAVNDVTANMMEIDENNGKGAIPDKTEMTENQRNAGGHNVAPDKTNFAYVNPTMDMPELEWGSGKHRAGNDRPQCDAVLPSNESEYINDIVELESGEISTAYPNARYGMAVWAAAILTPHSGHLIKG